MIRCIAVFTYWLLPSAGSAALIPSSDGTVVYDSANNVTWLADANLPATNRFGVALCNGAGPQPCIYASGLMQYKGAQAWVAAMNAANYLGHSDWQIPTTPASDSGCGKTGPNGNSFGFNCTLGALGSLYYSEFGLKAPNTAVSIPPIMAGPFINFQPYLYWSQMFAGQNTGYATFSFDSGFQGANTAPNFLYVLPMIPGKISGTPPSSGTGLDVNPGEQTIYDPVANVTWLANANLAATNTFGLPRCTSPINPAICVNPDGAMTWDSASQFIANMNTTSGTGYFGQTHWQLPPMDQSCTGYNCASAGGPLAELFYEQLKFSQGTPVVSTPAVGVGPFKNFQPYLYWTCEAATIQSACQTDGPSPNFEFSFSFGNGFLGTDLLSNDLYVMAYFVGPPTNSVGGEVPQFSASGITNAASFASGSLVPGSIATIFGTNLTSGTGINIASGLPLPMHFLNVTVTVNGLPAPIFAVDNVAGQQQINFQTPWEVEGLSIAPISVTNNGVTSATIQVPVLNAQPGIFAYNTGGSSFGAILHANFQLADTAHPASGGETVLIYCTGLGPVLPAQQSGSAAIGLAPTVTTPMVTIGGAVAPTSYSGLAPGFVGLYQINAMVPSGLGAGNKSVVITTGTVASKPALLPVQ
jgi:uncharacterized protein (TIGR03437 family)